MRVSGSTRSTVPPASNPSPPIPSTDAGLASAAIVEGLRRAGPKAPQWGGQRRLPVYASLGFTVTCHNTLWVKRR
jgi:hypothetical protein